MIAGLVLGIIFYSITILHVIKTPTLNGGKRMFWMVAIVCVPMIGNLIYVLLQYAFTKKQIPKVQTEYDDARASRNSLQKEKKNQNRGYHKMPAINKQLAQDPKPGAGDVKDV